MIALLALCWGTAAAADTWVEPERQTYFSPDRQLRLTVTPNLALARHILRGPESAPQPSGRAHGRLEQRGADGRWRTLWDAPLVNDVAPLWALVANSGDNVITFDNWGGQGGGNDVVVIYGPGGQFVRALGLLDFLPEDYVFTLPRSFSSIWWSGLGEPAHHFSPTGDRLVLSVIMPDTDEIGLPSGGFFDVEIDLETGRPAPLTGPGWQRALAAAAPIRARQRAAEAREAAFLRAPLVAPTSSAEADWSRYLLEAYRRLDPGWDGGWAPFIGVFVEPATDDPWSRTLALSAIRAPLWSHHEEGKVLLFGSPDLAKLADVIAAALRDPRAQSLRGVRVYVAADDSIWPRFVEIFASTGAQLIQLDPVEPIPQRPERLPPPA